MRILNEPYEGIYIEKKSKFICHLKKVSSFEEASLFIASEKKKYYDAKHHCSAIIIGENGDQMRCNDDGEPSGTAGRPMLEVLKHENLTDIVCCVTRYFGGTLLGTGGLVRAYTESLKDAIEHSSFSEETDAFVYSVDVGYSDEMKISSFIRDNDFKLVNIEYSDKVSFVYAVKKEVVDLSFPDDAMTKRLLDITSGNVNNLNIKSEKMIF